MVTSMLEKAIEIEGLLRIIRDGAPLPETYKLLNIKATELAEQAVRLEERAASSGMSEAVAISIEKPSEERPEENQNPSVGDPQPGMKESENGNEDDFVMTPATASPASATVFFTQDDHTLNNKSSNNKSRKDVAIDTASITQSAEIEGLSDLEDDELVLQEEDDILLNFEDVQYPDTGVSETEVSISETPAATSETMTSISEAPATLLETAAQVAEFETSEPIGESEEIDTPASEPEAHESMTLDSMTPEAVASEPNRPPVRKTNLKSAFSLNDRFLYARELFGGNMKMFDSTLEFIEGIEDYSIIEDYFYNELEWDPEDSNAASFMEILRPHFREL